MTDNLVKRLRDWEHVHPEDYYKDAGHLYEEAADRIEELEKRNASLEAKLAKAVEIAELFSGKAMAELEELTSSVAANNEVKGGKDE